ncbi:hypothetical protein LR48_Vigan07g066200 [Vigna angularis]|uniref:Uncharacterized protein n=1 Tax=Phaseolus angularis TaxID=3914 RepID=A0A0L9UW37_PHAAN|nr:hypothetical protein LR48_Vigan07g066200 [Vigna angularis]
MGSSGDIAASNKVWFYDRSLPSNVCVHKYPRILHGMNINLGDKFIKRAMETGVMLDDYGASRKEMSETSVEASINPSAEKLQEELSALQAELLEEKSKDEGGCTTPCDGEIYNDFACEGQIYCHETVMKEGVCRKRYKSKHRRTPYTGYSPKLE